jgi:anthranilate synthase component 1
MITHHREVALRSAVRALGCCPDLLRLHRANPVRYPVLFESAGGLPSLGRFDILFGFPGEALTLDSGWELTGPGYAPARRGDFLAAFDAWWRELSPPCAFSSALPFTGGWFLFLAYELAQQIEPRLGLPSMPGMPVAKAVRMPAAILRERTTGECLAVAEAGEESLIETMAADFRTAVAEGDLPLPVCTAAVDEEDPALFLDAVAKIHKRIAAGDVYQVNISREWRAQVPCGTDPGGLYARLRRTNPAPFGGIARLPDCTILSSSPERLVEVRGRRVETRPIAGTRPRNATIAEDESAVRQELLMHPKERSEHVMLIDLERNDLGRICTPGSVSVQQFMTVESYAHVHHMVSGVSGVLREDVRPGEVLRAVFPGGTITGCPKVRCMEIIHEIEGRPRGAYTGSMGYINRDGSCDFNILIRTMTVIGQQISLAAGSGIVWDSVADFELDETRAKARGMLLALRGGNVC